MILKSVRAFFRPHKGEKERNTSLFREVRLKMCPKIRATACILYLLPPSPYSKTKNVAIAYNVLTKLKLPRSKPFCLKESLIREAAKINIFFAGLLSIKRGLRPVIKKKNLVFNFSPCKKQ